MVQVVLIYLIMTTTKEATFYLKHQMKIIMYILPPMTNDSVLFLINDVLSNPRAELLSIGFLLTIFFSTNGAYSLLEAFDASYHVNNEIGFFKKRLIALEITVIITLLVILSILFIKSDRRGFAA